MFLAAWGATGCSSNIQNVKKDAGFTGKAVVSGGMVALGVVSAVEEISDAKSSQFANVLRETIKSDRPGYPLISQSEASQALGEGKMQALLRQYAAEGSFSKDTLLAISEVVRPRYVAILRVEKDMVESPQWVPQDEIIERSGEITSVEAVAVWVDRHMEISAAVYDLKEGRQVFSGLISIWDRAEKTYPVHTYGVRGDDEDQSLELEEPKKQEVFLPRGRSYPPPAPPRLNIMLPRAFRAFSEKLP